MAYKSSLEIGGEDKEFTMKILVIDDTQKHLDSALQTLSSHDVTVCSSHDGALKLLEQEQCDWKKYDEKFAFYLSEGIQGYDAHCKAKKETAVPYWDVVLCDLLMPAGKKAQGEEGQKFVGQEMAVGWSLALIAAKNGAAYVAVATDMDHHDHPASAMLDPINNHIFNIDKARVLMTNHIELVGIKGTECVCPQCNGTKQQKINDGTTVGCWSCHCTGIDHTEKGKDWGKILETLTADAE